MLEGLVGLDPLPRRALAELPAGNLRDAGLRLRRQASAAARLAGSLERPELAEKLERQAAELKRRFNEDFWFEDASSSPSRSTATAAVDSLSSNIGHLLWSGIVDETRPTTRRHLMSRQLFSGWGVRTWPRARAATTRSAIT